MTAYEHTLAFVAGRKAAEAERLATISKLDALEKAYQETIDATLHEYTKLGFVKDGACLRWDNELVAEVHVARDVNTVKYNWKVWRRGQTPKMYRPTWRGCTESDEVFHKDLGTAIADWVS